MPDKLATAFAEYYKSTGEDTPRLADEFLLQAAKATADQKCDLILGFLAAAVNSHRQDVHVIDHVLPQVIGDAIGCDPNGAVEDNLRVATAYAGHLALQMPDPDKRDKMHMLAVLYRI